MTRKEELKQKAKILKNPEKYNVIFPANQSGFSVDDYQEIKQAIIEKVIKPCKKGDWEVKNVLTMNGVYGRQEDTVLIHKSVKLKYDNEGILVWDLGKIHYKNAFADEEWNEIENILDQQEQQQRQQLNSENSQSSRAIENNQSLWKKYVWSGLFGSLSLLSLLLFLL